MSESRSTTLTALARAAGDLVVDRRGDQQTTVTGLAYDSRQVRPGDLFFSIPGMVTDGLAFAPAAVRQGAAGVMSERSTGLDIPEVVVSDARRAMALAAAEFYGQPGDRLALLGVTGTNGKTTTVFLLESILRAAGYVTGLIGTIETRVAGEVRPGIRTTPESVDLQALLADMRNRDVETVAMEVTSHGLALHRVEGLRFAAAAFTNLTQDHLDFHAGMEDYFEAKRSLFQPGRTERGAVNIDDPYGRKLKASVDVPCMSFGSSEDADLRPTAVELSPTRTEFVAVSESHELKISTSLIGAFNVSNCLAAAATALQAGVDPAAIEQGIAELQAVPGRFESVDAGQPYSVVVDYAHTPDSLDNVLRASRRLAQNRGGRVLCVFGCGGDRDRGKRPLMGAVAATQADVVVVTSDNPRSEDPEAIIGAIIEGVASVRPDGADAVLPDRREAISRALGMARPGDVVVIAGKGHETGQQFRDITIPFDDREVARDLLADQGWGS
ncbi:MAG: UDP-N-acetylmuramoyl-L-alanyl-D-glutamate--2,6-diaminopimelate ligase [Actinomycetota bacterium]|nr:UDP-N-acetylmuramoyl-L-alanyl-D-glutamate--2,6-diaminopimelate ligase [Actinomycetota bacterium]